MIFFPNIIVIIIALWSDLSWWVPDGNPCMNLWRFDVIYIWPFSYTNQFSFFFFYFPCCLPFLLPIFLLPSFLPFFFPFVKNYFSLIVTSWQGDSTYSTCATCKTKIMKDCVFFWNNLRSITNSILKSINMATNLQCGLG